MKSFKKRLSEEGLLDKMAVSGAADALLTALQIQDPQPAPSNREEGKMNLGVAERALGAFDLNLTPPGADRDFVLTFNGPVGARTGFRLAVSLNEGPHKPLFKFVQGLPGHLLKAATKRSSADAEWLEEVPGGEVRLAGGAVALVLKGEAGGVIRISLSPNMDPPDDVVALALQPTSVLLGDTGFGLEIAHGVAFDDSEDRTPPGTTEIDGAAIVTPADAPAWRGIANGDGSGVILHSVLTAARC